MNRYNERNYRERDDRNYENRNRQNQSGDHNLSNYQSRYEERGNYYGMPNNDYEYRNVRSTRGTDYGNSSSGPVGGYGSSSYRSSTDRGSNAGSSRFGQNSGRNQSSRSQSEQYRYGDPNPYMNNERNGGYERTRGTGWRSESDDSRRGNDNYARQDNSYQYSGAGRRYDEFSRDERYRQGDQMTDIHADRGEHRQRRSDNNYGNQGSRDNNYGRSRNEARSYRNVQDQERNREMFDHTSDDYPSRSPKGYGYRSGPDWSADSPINRGHDAGADRG